MLIDYNPVILSFIIKVSHQNLPMVKKSLVHAAKRLETDDRGYVYVPGNYKVSRRRGKVIGNIANHRPERYFRLEMALKQTIHVLGMEDVDAKKYIFIIIDDYDKQREYEIGKGLHKNVQEDCNCNFVFCDLMGFDNLKKLCDDYDNVTYLRINDVSAMGQQMIEVYYPEEERKEVDQEFREKYGQSPAEARQELKEKYVSNIQNSSNEESSERVDGDES